MKKIFFFAAVFFLLLLCALFLLLQTPFPAQDSIIIKAQNSQILAKVADNDLALARGLMYEKSLCSACGMLFVFPDSQLRYFWMKNTIIPLDIVFIYENLTVESISTASPCEHNPCILYKSGHPVKYVLEINANSSRNFSIHKGTVLIATNLSSAGKILP